MCIYKTPTLNQHQVKITGNTSSAKIGATQATLLVTRLGREPENRAAHYGLEKKL
jgi:hypothetical protein